MDHRRDDDDSSSPSVESWRDVRDVEDRSARPPLI
eukprot:CAMPEP_0183318126 /NCGR_PEP_ID=MMETSP0160_2-20130417/59805_1 /TAXON_ID=2839 ORGANISM="Odontella Sinensis, Strain Grunow 1884" /NCGR_SAMPLE_ID=MMETSP0160_2 /ASSEMBLY_ACC=CAM_ASM_000250 /LENGTH=34 /DNA_ID= /DNA_START= /DNA_END= /DNA_ORIENTATION=